MLRKIMLAAAMAFVPITALPSPALAQLASVLVV